MRGFLGFAVGVISIIGFVSSAQGITITRADVQKGLAVVEGNKAAKSATIIWDSSAVAQASKAGSFSFSAAVPEDCVGTLSDGVSSINVAVLDCTPLSSAPAPMCYGGDNELCTWR